MTETRKRLPLFPQNFKVYTFTCLIFHFCLFFYTIFTGNVFVDEESLGNDGETVIDSHAEIIAKRGFQRYHNFLCRLFKSFLIQVKIIHYEKSYLNVLISHIGELNPLYNLFGMQF